MKVEMKTKIVLLGLVGLMLSGCAGFGHKLKALLGGKSNSNRGVASLSKTQSNSRNVRFSEKPNLAPVARRRYRRMTKGRFESEAKVGDNSGSLWVMEGQDAYLFSQNQVRMVGDLLNVRLAGAAKEQLETKAGVIERLLRKLDRPEPSIFSRKPSSKKKKASKAKADGEEKVAADSETKEKAPAVAKRSSKKSSFNVTTVPTRITERLSDGSYRVRGVQSFMIGKREYKTIVTGIIRGEDFNDSGVDSSKILEAKYDIVSNRRSLM